MRKLQQFKVIRLNSDRLKPNYKLKEFSYEDSMRNGEVISLSNSQLIRTLLSVVGRPFSEFELKELQSKKRNLKKRKNTERNRELLAEVEQQIRSILFIPEIISVSFSDRRHYYNILKRDGFFVLGVKYVPFMASAGMIRRDSVLFIDAKVRDKIYAIFENGRNPDIEIVPSKFSAYFSLYSSSSFPVTFPRIAVIPDCIVHSKRLVNYGKYIGKGIDPVVSPQEMELEFNAFDGQGLCSPRMAKQWQRELELDYLPSYFGIRAPYIKGQCTVFDFHKFAREIAGNNIIRDIYGNEVSIEDVDCLISESQFKLWNAYDNTKDYVTKCEQNNLDWGITKVSPKADKNHAKTSYQFLQVLNLSDDDIDALTRPTLDWLESSSGGDVMSTLMYALGEIEFSNNWLDRVDVITQSVIMDNYVLEDNYVKQHYILSLNKKMNDARMGRLMLNGNYQCMIADPYAQAGHALGIGLTPLLHEHEHYSQYWNNKGVSRVAAVRSPIVHHGEIQVLNLQNRQDVNEWYKYIYSGIVYPANGVGLDAMIHGGADFDLDIVATINSPEIIKGIRPDLPVVYDVRKPSKVKLEKADSEKIFQSQANQIGTNKIGFYTNVSSTLYARLADFEEGSKEHDILLNRLRWGRVLQGNEIDRAKGVDVDPYPEHFSKYTKITEDMTEDEKTQTKLNNLLLAEKRPYFMRWLYSPYNNRYRNEILSYDTICRSRWGISFSDVMSNPKTDDQVRLLERYKKRTFFINNNSTMNRISRHMEESLRNIKSNSKSRMDFDYKRLLSNPNYSSSKKDIEKIKVLYKEYKSLRRSLYEGHETDISFEETREISAYINEKAYRTISSKSSELADLAILCVYTVLGKNSKSFLWNVFGQEIVDTIKKKHKERYARVPMYNDKGSLYYLWSRYGIYKVQILTEE